jgi:tetratricopeptide (TPR) repeat protein
LAGLWGRRVPGAAPGSLALVLLCGAIAADRPARGQDVPSQFLPEATTGRIIGEGTDYFRRDDRANQLLFNIERFHLSEETFWTKYREHHFLEARADITFALRYFPNHPRALYLMEIAEKAMGKPEGAIPFYERALRLFPEYPFTRAQYGTYLVRIGARAAGIAELRAALAVDSTLIQARIALDQALSAPTDSGLGRSASPPVSGSRAQRRSPEPR